MDAKNWEDKQALEAKLQAYSARLEKYYQELNRCTVSEYPEMIRQINAIEHKVQATRDALSRLTNKNFCKNLPHGQATVSVQLQKRFML